MTVATQYNDTNRDDSKLIWMKALGPYQTEKKAYSCSPIRDDKALTGITQ